MQKFVNSAKLIFTVNSLKLQSHHQQYEISTNLKTNFGTKMNLNLLKVKNEYLKKKTRNKNITLKRAPELQFCQCPVEETFFSFNNPVESNFHLFIYTFIL